MAANGLVGRLMSSETYLPLRPRLSRSAYGLDSIRSYLLLLIAAILVPMLVLAVVLAWHYADAARRTIEAERLDVTSNMTDLIDREIGTFSGLLNGFALSPGLRRADPRIVQLITDVAHDHGIQALGIFDRAGHLQFSWPSDRQTAFVAGERAGVAEIFAGSKLFVSDLQVMPNGRPGLFYISVPMVMEGQVVSVLTAGVPPQQLQGLFAEAGLREEWRAGFVDRTGILIARSRESLTYVGRSAQKPMVDAARGKEQSGLFDVVTRDGVEMKNAFRRSALTGWTVGVAVPAAVVNAPMWSTMLILAAIGIFLTLMSLFLGMLIARRITRDVNQLGHAVVAYASGDVVALPTATLTELRDVLRVVEAAAAVDRNRTVLRKV
jgi:hypothetical protein